MRLEELISSASSPVPAVMPLNLAKLTVLCAGPLVEVKVLRLLARSMLEMKAAMSSSSVRPELPGVPPSLSWPDFSLLLLLPLPLEVLLSPALLVCEVEVKRLRLAKELL